MLFAMVTQQGSAERVTCPLCSTSLLRKGILRHLKESHSGARLTEDQLETVGGKHCLHCKQVVSASLVNGGNHKCNRRSNVAQSIRTPTYGGTVLGWLFAITNLAAVRRPTRKAASSPSVLVGEWVRYGDEISVFSLVWNNLDSYS